MRMPAYSCLIQNSKFSKVVPFFVGPGLPSLATVSVLEAGGKPSTWFPPEGLEELTGRASSMRMPSNAF